MLIRSIFMTGWFLFPLSLQAQNDQINLNKIDDKTKKTIILNFQKLNPDWVNSDISIYYLRPYIKRVRKKLDKSGLKTNLTDIKLAEKFLKINYKSFGIDSKNIGYLLKTVRKINDRSEVRFLSRKKIQYDGYPQLKNFGYEVDIYFQIKEHQIFQVINRTNRYVFKKITSEPKVTAFNNVILNDLIGKKLVYFNIAGKEVDAGSVALIDVEPKGLFIEPLLLDKNSGPRLGLTWKYSISKGLLTWDAHYNAIDGSFLILLQNFSS